MPAKNFFRRFDRVVYFEPFQPDLLLITMIMKPERWEKVERLYHAALERASDERAAFLDEACVGDQDLRREVESLLAYDESAQRFITTPPDALAAELLFAEQPPSPVGGSLGHYRLLALLGKGGMGEVYRARDDRLGREVAIKLLPTAFANDKDRLRRFEQEARAAGMLNHPNVLTIYDIGTASPESGGAPYIVSELLTGETLRERLRREALPLRRMVDYALQMARGLQAAHEKGIVHRDLKPENLFVTKDGRVKILDFGLAKLKPAPTGPLAGIGSNTPPPPMGTAPGVVMGTVGYMAPEQAQAEEVDHRADIFAFGAILYEMLSGRRAFQGNTAVEALNAILKEEPPELAESGHEVPASLERVVRHCLEKDPAARFQSIGDVAFYLDARAAESGSISTSQSHRAVVSTATRRERLARITTIVLFIALVSALVWGTFLYFRRAPQDTRVYRASILPPAGTNILRESTAGRFALSPDGRRLVFVTGAGGGSQLWLRSLDESAAKPLAGTEGGGAPFWSPDGRFVAFFAQDKLKKIAVSGGPPITLADAQGANGGAWNRDDVILFATNFSPLQRLSASGGAPTPVTTLDTAGGEVHHWWPAFLPDGRHFIYHATGSRTGGPFDARGIYVGTLGSNERKLLVEGGSNAQYAAGYLLFVRQGTLMAQPFDAERLELSGEAAPLAEQIETAHVVTQLGAFSVSPAGVLAYQAKSQPRSQLIWFDRTGRQLGVLGDQAHYLNPELSPDAKRVGVIIGDPVTQSRDIWLFDVARGVRTRFTFGAVAGHPAIWSPDGAYLAFAGGGAGSYDLYQKATSGSGDEQLLWRDSFNKYPMSWSADGKFLLFHTGSSTPQTGNDIWVLPLFAERKPIPFLQTKFSERDARFSPDGRWVAYQSNESGRYEVYVTTFPTSGAKWQISANGGLLPRWRSDGREIYYQAPDNKLVAVEVKPMAAGFVVGAAHPLFAIQPGGGDINWVATADGQRFLVNTVVEGTTTAPITLVINWKAGLSNPR
jgi:serine/threonine protein kinase/Tol biopolymer transport system component